MEALNEAYVIRKVDDLQVKGKSYAVGIYEVLDHYTEEQFPNRLEVVRYLKEGSALYRNGDFQSAKKSFTYCMELHPGDRVSQTFIKRCDHFIQDPPVGDWTGAHIAADKLALYVRTWSFLSQGPCEQQSQLQSPTCPPAGHDR
eukprot:Clim_evm245s157 gene=Clim_evmTU245s157